MTGDAGFPDTEAGEYTHRFVHTPAPSNEGPDPSDVERSIPKKYAHILILLAFTALFTWLFARFFFRPLYLAESDLYENGLPIFLSPIWKWSSFEFNGLPVLADPANFNFYVPNVVFGELVKSWTAVVMSGPLLAACFTYAYVFTATRSKIAAAFSALAYGLSEEMLERLRHINHVHVIAWLPLIALSLDRLRVSRHPWRWVAIGAFAVGSCILAGHPQPALYVMYCMGLYALVGIFVESRIPPFDPSTGSGSSRARSRDDTLRAPRGSRGANPESRLHWFAATTAMFALGILLSAVKVLPLVEARTLVVRSEGLTFQRFVGPSLTAPQAFSFVLPTILHGPTTELPTYVGIATLLLALVGISRVRTNWRLVFWLVMSLVGIGMALGTSTPLVDLANYVPFYSWFRNLSRHMFLFAFGASVLAGFGLAAVQRREVSRRAVRLAVVVVGVAMLAGALLIRGFPDAFPLEGPRGEPGPGVLSLLTVGVWLQFIMLAAATAAIVWVLKRPSAASYVCLMVVLIIDLLNALPYDIKADGIEYFALTAEQTQPSVHARAIGQALEPTHARALAIGGTHVDEVLPATFARAWRIPIAGGYGAMLIDRLSRLATMGTNGEVRPAVLADEDQTLDLLAVKYVIVNAPQLADQERRHWLYGSERWNQAMHFRTSRQTDRAVDQDVAGETEVTVFENRRALPRAWMVETVTPAPEPEAIRAVKTSRFADGTPFDAHRTALVDASRVPPTVNFSPGASAVSVARVGDGDIGVRVTSQGGGFLVLSENAYPGWRALVDGSEVAIYRTDVTLQGIVVPPGTHRIEFTLESRLLTWGLITSGISAVMCAALFLVGQVGARSTIPEQRAEQI